MQQTGLLHTILEKSGAVKNKRRLKSVLNAVEAIMNGGSLSLTSMGRHMNKNIKPKSKIKEMDYLLSNGHLFAERMAIYQVINTWLIGHEKHLYIAIDWSSIVAHKLHLLRASIIRKGRCITVYEEVHPESQLANGEVHQLFLKNLKLVLPEKCEVSIMADAGFRTDFFVQVEAENWDYVARILSNMQYNANENEEWQHCTDLYEQATSEPRAIGAVTLAKSNKVDSHLYLYKKVKGDTECIRHAAIRKIKHGRHEKEQSNAAKKPWLIASSHNVEAAKIIAIYRKRMKIEHDFRDTKDPRWGIGLRESRTVRPERITLQLMVGYLASFMLWLIGLCLEEKGLHLDFQASSIKDKRNLSLVFLAIEAIRSGYMKYIKKPDFCKLKKRGLHDEALSV